MLYPTLAPSSAEGVRPDKRLHAHIEPVEARPAATILMLRESKDGLEVLMTRRSTSASFAPGAYVFPGGALDEDDASPAARAVSTVRASQSNEQIAFATAAIRESFEELGILLAYRADGSLADDRDVARIPRTRETDFLAETARLGYRLAIDRVWWLCHWITDRDLPKRFDVRFFVSLMPEGQSPVADEAEQFEPVWVTPAHALAENGAGRFDMIFPTIRTLRRLAQFKSAEAVISACTTEQPLFVSSPRGGYRNGEVERFSENEPPFGELELIRPDGRIDPSLTLDWQHLRAVPLLRHVRRLTAPNPGVMTGPGTNTYIVGEPGAYAVIDPGPADDAHVDRIAELVGRDLKYILCTHAHQDHSPGSVRLKALTGAPVLGRPWGPRTRTFSHEGGSSKEEVDPAFMPDRTLQDEERLTLGDSTLRAIFTPGHASNHLCFLLEEDGLLFSGDHINNGQTVVINPPDGSMSEYLTALHHLRQLPITYILPAHGHVLGFAHDAITHLINHRMGREAKVIRAMQQAGPATLMELVPRVYDDVRPQLYPVAARSLLAHLEKLDHDGRARLDPDERWRWLA